MASIISSLKYKIGKTKPNNEYDKQYNSFQSELRSPTTMTPLLEATQVFAMNTYSLEAYNSLAILFPFPTWAIIPNRI